MQLRTLDELRPEQELDRLVTQLASFGATTRAHLDRFRRLGVLSEYGGVFAVDGGQVVGQTLVFRVPYRFPSGLETIGAIAAVTTRPDHGRHGVAHRVLREVHRRERAAGIDHVALWTNRSWGAHDLYERLGYRDVYLPPLALRVSSPRARSGRAERSIRPGRRRDLRALEEVHRHLTDGRWGFTPRSAGSLRVEAELGYLDPKVGLRVLWRQGTIAGYAIVDRSQDVLRCGELVAGSARDRALLLADLERQARGKIVIVSAGAASDAERLLRDRGFRWLPSSWYRLLGAPLRGDWTTKEAVRTFGTADRRFVCYRGDYF